MTEGKQPEMVDRVEDAISEACEYALPRDLLTKCARAAIEAMREPTKAMIDACDINIPTEGMITGVWGDMISAALDE